MKRSVVFAVAVLFGLFVGTAWQVQAATTSTAAAAAPAAAQADDSGPGYWASWAEAASH
jgi:hypothetical protein